MATEASPLRPDVADGSAGAAEAAPRGADLSISMSPRAVEMAKAQLMKRGTPGAAIRIGLRGGGCSGYSYVMEFDDRPPRENDRVFEFGSERSERERSERGQGERVRVVIDPKSLLLMNGTTLDYETSVMGHGFKFVNPQVKGQCGCGASVQF